MAFVPGYDHDIFVSYAHVDDEPIGGAEVGWVTYLVNNLRVLLAKKLGRPEFYSLWVDQELARNASLTDQIMDALEKTATFLVFLSPGYVASEWCQRERDTFLKVVKNRPGSRVFVVEPDKVERDERPEPFRELLGYKFWVQENDRTHPRTLGVPVPTEKDERYFETLGSLSYDLADELKKMKAAAPTGTSENGEEAAELVESDAPVVFLAEPTDDLEPRREEVRNYLLQAGLAVLPTAFYNPEPAAFQEAVERDMAQCDLFVQLLSGVPGKRPPGLPQGMVGAQAEIAERLARPVLQWCDPDLDVENVAHEEHRAFLRGANVQAVGIEEFKAEVKKRALKKPPPPVNPESLLFVNHEAADEPLVAPLCEALDRRGLGFVTPLLTGTASDLREDLETNLLDCDSLVLVYGKSLTWVRQQLRKARKILSQRQEPIKVLAVYEGPEATNPVGVRLPASLVPNMEIIDGTNGLSDEVIERVFCQQAGSRGL